MKFKIQNPKFKMLLVLIIVAFAASLASGGGGELNFIQKIWSTVNTNLNATITSRADATYYTSTRATKIDNLDTTISSRAPSSTALSTATWTGTRAGKLDSIDATVSSRLADKGQKLLYTAVTGQTGTFTVLNVAGPGTLHDLTWLTTQSVAQTWTLSINVDGQGAVTHGQSGSNGTSPIGPYYINAIANANYIFRLMPGGVRFKTSLVITMTHTSGGGSCSSYATYSTDI